MKQILIDDDRKASRLESRRGRALIFGTSAFGYQGFVG
jgi:hypothetical protein